MSSDVHRDVVLQEIPPSTIEHDISVFLKDELVAAKMNNGDAILVSVWILLSPGQSSGSDDRAECKWLYSSLIFAMCRFIGDERWDPKEQLATVLEYQATSPASQLDRTYYPVLEKLLVGLTHSQWERLVREFHEVVGSIVVLADPLSIDSLARLLCVSREMVVCRLDPLHSVLNIPTDPASPIRLLHLSFREF